MNLRQPALAVGLPPVLVVEALSPPKTPQAGVESGRKPLRRTLDESAKCRDMTSFGLVLGGGGPVGAAWYAGLANGLAEEGLDIGVADVIIGTSAGASAGAWLASERSGEFVDAMKRLGAGPEALAIDTDLIAQVCALMGSAEAPLEPPDTHRIGELAVQVPPLGVRIHAKYLPGSD